MADELALLVADVFELAGLLRRSGEDTARTVGQTQARWQLMSVVSDRALTVPQAARRLGVSRQAVQRVANDLVAEGLAGFTDNPDHRSSALLELTPAGRDALARITQRARGVNARLAAVVDPDALATTRATVRALAGALRG
jgi:DNA-binding MarR family transcriptional regulator